MLPYMNEALRDPILGSPTKGHHLWGPHMSHMRRPYGTLGSFRKALGRSQKFHSYGPLLYGAPKDSFDLGLRL